MNLLGDTSGAVFSQCRRYRYELWRTWSAGPKMCLFIGMNPSQANEVDNDRTVAKMCRLAARWGYDGLLVANVFAWIETDSRKLPALIEAGVDIVGPDNDAAILRLAKRSGIICAGFGNPGMLQGRGEKVLKMLKDAGHAPRAFAINANGAPKHPLYCKELDIPPECLATERC